jgi:7-keto-8-aminopelargonate synthetase-like enzyme
MNTQKFLRQSRRLELPGCRTTHTPLPYPGRLMRLFSSIIGILRPGFDRLPGEHPIVPVMLHDAARATRFAEAVLEHGVYVVTFSFTVVPRGKARIRTQMSAALTDDDVEFAQEAFARAKAQVLKT